MADDADRADIGIENRLNDGIAHARHELSKRDIAPCGACHWCGETLRLSNQLFCDSSCANDYADNKRRNGK